MRCDCITTMYSYNRLGSHILLLHVGIYSTCIQYRPYVYTCTVGMSYTVYLSQVYYVQCIMMYNVWILVWIQHRSYYCNHNGTVRLPTCTVQCTRVHPVTSCTVQWVYTCTSCDCTVDIYTLYIVHNIILLWYGSYGNPQHTQWTVAIISDIL